MRSVINVEEIGWLTAGLAVVFIVAKYAPTWLRALRETRDVATANLITSMQRHIDQLQSEKHSFIEQINEIRSVNQELRERVEYLYSEVNQLKSVLEERDV